MAHRLKSEIVSAFRMNGLTLRSDASKYLVEVLLTVGDGDRSDCIERLLETVQKMPLKTTMIDRGVCEQAVQECNADEDEDNDKVFSVIDSFSVPRFTYNMERKKFISNKTLNVPEPSLHPEADSKAELFRDRYTVLLQRTNRHELFTPAVIGSAVTEKKFQLKPVEFLLGSSSKLGEIIVLGMLSQMKEGKWFLEDPTGAVQLDLTRANFHTGLFTDSCFVLAEGWYEDEVFHVNAFGFPPPESSKTSRAYFGNMNFFGGVGQSCVKASARLRQVEQENDEAMFVFMSDVWLDDPKVMEKLSIMFSGYAEMPPVCFVMCGSFLSKPYGGKKSKVLKECLSKLADLITSHAGLSQTRFVFVPGPNDPGPAHILPRPTLPESLTAEFRDRVPTATFASNPCRLTYCTQEVVVFRHDLVMKMCRNCVHFPTDSTIPEHFAKTVVCQGHLVPLPLSVAPVYWAHDAALRLYPLPDLIVCADKYDPYTSQQLDCQVVNPGSFPRSDFSFKVYLPASRQVEDSRIADPDTA